ncbi:MAG: glycine zipper 2TM domain-containing protein [Betaproteobacteria bacterium]
MRKFILALLLAVPLASLAAPLTNQDVITLVKGGLAEATILQAIDTSEPAFDTSAMGLVQLKNGGVSDAVIQRILSRASAKPAAAPAAAAAAAAGPGAQPAGVQVAAAPQCPDCGTVQSVREVDRPGQASGVGAVTGGLLGGVLGRQIGGDRTGTVIGAVGGAVAGHQIEKHAKSGKLWEVSVRFSDGTRTYTQDTQPGVAPGDRVRVVNGALVRQ